MNGLEALKKLKVLAPNAMVIVLSAQESFTIINDLMNEGAHDYVVKDNDAIKNLAEKINTIFTEDN
jgi:DNA-binding NarL/FixJ family response regulator